MTNNNRQHKRIDKTINLFYRTSDVFPIKWDISVVENISVGGIRFIAPNDLHLKDKIVQLRIKLPQLAPNMLEIEAMVVDVKPRSTSKYSDIRAKFINLSAINKQQLMVVERMIDSQENKNFKKF